MGYDRYGIGARSRWREILQRILVCLFLLFLFFDVVLCLSVVFLFVDVGIRKLTDALQMLGSNVEPDLLANSCDYLK